MPENFEIPAWNPPAELDLANAPAFPQKFNKTPKKPPVPLSTIAQQPDNGDSTDNGEEEDEEGEAELQRPARTPTPPYATLHVLSPSVSLTRF